MRINHLSASSSHSLLRPLLPYPTLIRGCYFKSWPYVQVNVFPIRKFPVKIVLSFEKTKKAEHVPVLKVNTKTPNRPSSQYKCHCLF